jgi:hypothetical protein
MNNTPAETTSLSKPIEPLHGDHILCEPRFEELRVGAHKSSPSKTVFAFIRPDNRPRQSAPYPSVAILFSRQ